MAKFPKPEVDDGPHPSAETKQRHATDDKLRAYGFRIVSRRPGREPVWEMGGMEFDESEALVLVEELPDGIMLGARPSYHDQVTQP